MAEFKRKKRRKAWECPRCEFWMTKLEPVSPNKFQRKLLVLADGTRKMGELSRITRKSVFIVKRNLKKLQSIGHLIGVKPSHPAEIKLTKKTVLKMLKMIHRDGVKLKIIRELFGRSVTKKMGKTMWSDPKEADFWLKTIYDFKCERDPKKRARDEIERKLEEEEMKLAQQ